MLGQREMTMEDYMGILRRRWFLILIPALLGPAIGYGISRFLPERFTSQTLVLVEQQQVPDKFVQSVITDDFSQRLGTMQEQILSRARLQPIIETNSLFADQASGVPMEDLVGKMRQAVKVAAVRSMAGDRNGGVPGFTISFTYNEPRTAQLVCQQLTTMFIDENLRLRGDKVANTAKFLESQLAEAKQKLDEQDQRLAQFKGRNIGQLPGNEAAALGMLMSTNAQLEAVNQLINRSQQDKQYAETLLAQQLAAVKTTPGGANPQALDQQLASLQSQLVALEGMYKPEHPDVVRKKAEIAQLQKKIDETNLAAKQEPPKPVDTASAIEPPQIMALRNQIRLLDQTIKEKTREQQRLQDLVRVFQGRVSMSPLVEQEYKELTRDYDIALGFYNDLLSKRTQAGISQQMELQQQGEQFKIVDAANLPVAPSFPNRLMFAGGGLGGGLAFGLGLVLLLEMKDRALRSELDVEFFLELPALAQVPSVGPAARSGWFWKRTPKPTGQGATA